MRVVTLPMVDGLPVISSAKLIKREGKSGWYSVHFAPVNKLWIMLYEFSPGTFLAFPNDDQLMRALPNGDPWDERLWKQWQIEEAADSEIVGRMVELDTVSTRDATVAKPWTVDGTSVTRAIPVMRSRCGHVISHKLR